MKWLRRVGWLGAGLLALWLIGWLALPPLVKWQAEKRATEALGRPVTIGAVGFKPWSLELTLRDLTVGGREASDPPQLSVARVAVDADMRSLWRRAPVVTSFVVDAPQLRLARLGEGRYDIDDILARFAPRPAPPAASAPPPRLALYNLKIEGGTVVFDDRPVRRTHTLDELVLGVPFVSTLPADVEVKVAPRLSFRLNGSRFATEGEATPFAAQRSATVRLHVSDLDIGPYLAYRPADLPAHLQQGQLALDLAVRFSQPADAEPTVALSGDVGVRNAKWTLPDGRPLLEWRRLDVGIVDFQPLVRRASLGAVRIEAPRGALRRAADGRLQLPLTTSTKEVAERANLDAQWTVQAERFDLVDAALVWEDQSTTPPSELRLDNVVGHLERPAWPLPGAVPVKLSAEVKAASGGPTAKVSIEGEAGDRNAALDLRVEQFGLASLAPYLAPVLRPRLDGVVDATSARVEWHADPSAVRLSIGELRLSGLRLQQDRDLASLRELLLADAQVDIVAQRLSLGRVKLVQPELRLERARDGTLNVAHWLVAGRQPPSTAEPVAQAARPAWQVGVGEFTLEAGRLQLSDAVPRVPVRVDIDDLQVTVQGLDTASPAAAARVTAHARVAAGSAPGRPRERSARPARVDWRGTAALQPLAVRGSVRIDQLPLQVLEPYVADHLNVDLLRAAAGFRGDLSLRVDAKGGLHASVAGDALLADVKVQSKAIAGSAVAPEELLSWQALKAGRLRAEVAPGRKPRIEVEDVEWSDFYSKLVISEDGRFNLRDVAPPAAANAAAPAPAAAAPSAPVAVAAAAPAPADKGLPVDLVVGATRLVNGRIDFTDHFIRPNYSAQLTELNGRLGRFASGSSESATLELRGRAAGTALLDIRGSLNPTVAPLALDIQARATDLELAPFSPYAGKYAGYAIERGKLSMDVAYRIDADGKLDAKNQVILNQLTFGERIESPDATKLPVRLAVALLKDRNGVIDVNLPISGSINEPEFSLWGIVFKVIGNLIVKIVTAPFTMLAGGGGGEDLSFVEFAPGSATMTDGARATIDKVAQALVDRPSLQMTVTGAADPQGEREAMKQMALDVRLTAERKREIVRAGGATDAPVDLSADDRARLLRELYRNTDLPDKPRNLVGLQKDLPAAEMERMLRAGTSVGPDAARELALQRGLAVRDTLIAKGLPSERLFLAAPKLHAPGEGEAAWTPRVQLALATN